MYYLNEGEPQWKAAIISNLTSSNMSSYVEEISDAVIVEDPKCNLNYLKVQAETDDADETTDENASTESSAEAGTEATTETTAQ
jgi:tRNA uridine 5-carbamoylmethylation protein Kti12